MISSAAVRRIMLGESMAVLEWPEDVRPASLTGDQKVIPKPFVSPSMAHRRQHAFPVPAGSVPLTFNNLTDEKSRRIDALVVFTRWRKYGRVKVRDWGEVAEHLLERQLLMALIRPEPSFRVRAGHVNGGAQTGRLFHC